MKQLFYSLLLGGSALLFMGCPSDPEITLVGDVELVYRGQFGEDTPLVMLQDYTYPDGELVQFQKFQFYVSDISLVAEGNETELREVSIIEFNNIGDETAAEQGIRDTISSIPAGDYTALRFSIGVPADLNIANNFPTSHPLGRNFWDDWGSFIFVRIDGRYDEDQSGDYVGSESFTLHTGGNDVYTNITIPANITVPENGLATIEIDMDLLKILGPADGELYNLAEDPEVHSPDKAPLMMWLMDNFSGAASIR